LFGPGVSAIASENASSDGRMSSNQAPMSRRTAVA
jgi:hypothetical protein